MTRSDAGAVRRTLAERYRMQVRSIDRFYHGQGTRNWVAQTDSARYFVKEFHRTFDARGEALALELNELAASAGIPVARNITDVTGARLCTSGEVVLAVSEFVEGAEHREEMTTAQMEQAGAVLGRIHRTFRTVDFALAPETPDWLKFDLRKKQDDLDAIVRLIEARSERTHFDDTALKLIWARRAQLHQVPRILEIAARLDDQVIHGDYSTRNILFERDSIRAVIDFRPPHPFLIAYEIGRIAFSAESMSTAGWQGRALALLRAYASEYPTARRDNLIWSAHIWLAQLLRSTYGLSQHYLAPVELQDELDNFFIIRSNAATALLAELDSLRDSIEALLARSLSE